LQKFFLLFADDFPFYHALCALIAFIFPLDADAHVLLYTFFHVLHSFSFLRVYLRAMFIVFFLWQPAFTPRSAEYSSSSPASLYLLCRAACSAPRCFKDAKMFFFGDLLPSSYFDD